MPGEFENYKHLVEKLKKCEGGLFVDKTQLINQIIISGSAPYLITRPKGWGKSLNLSMLWCWFVNRDQLRKQKKAKATLKS